MATPYEIVRFESLSLAELELKGSFPCCVQASNIPRHSAAVRSRTARSVQVDPSYVGGGDGDDAKEVSLVLLGSARRVQPLVRSHQGQPVDSVTSGDERRYVLQHSYLELAETRLNGVGEVLKLAAQCRPLYVRATTSWTGHDEDTTNILCDDIYGVSARVCKSAGQAFVSWERVLVPPEGISSAAISSLPSDPTLVPINAACTFSTVLDPTPYSIAELEGKFATGLLHLPVHFYPYRGATGANEPDYALAPSCMLTGFSCQTWFYAYQPNGPSLEAKLYRIAQSSSVVVKAAVHDQNAVNQAMHYLMQRTGYQNSIDIDERHPAANGDADADYITLTKDCDLADPAPCLLNEEQMSIGDSDGDDEDEYIGPRPPAKLPEESSPTEEYDYPYAELPQESLRSPSYTNTTSPTARNTGGLQDTLADLLPRLLEPAPGSNPISIPKPLAQSSSSPPPPVSREGTLRRAAPKGNSSPAYIAMVGEGEARSGRLSATHEFVSLRSPPSKAARLRGCPEAPGSEKLPHRAVSRLPTPSPRRSRSALPSKRHATASPPPPPPGAMGTHHLNCVASTDPQPPPDLSLLLSQNGLAKYSARFQEEAIDWTAFCLLTNEMLRDQLSVVDASDRIQLMGLQTN